MFKKSRLPVMVALLRSMPPRLMAVAFAMFAMALTVLLPSPASAQTAGGGQTYGLGQAGSPAASDYLSAAQGFNSSLAPLLTAILPVLVVILAIWKGPMIFKKLVSMATRG